MGVPLPPPFIPPPPGPPYLHWPREHLAAGPHFPASSQPLSFSGDSGFATLCLWPAVGQLPLRAKASELGDWGRTLFVNTSWAPTDLRREVLGWDPPPSALPATVCSRGSARPIWHPCTQAASVLEIGIWSQTLGWRWKEVNRPECFPPALP